MTRALVLLAHADPSTRAKYEAALGLECDLVFVNNFVPGKLSSAYYELAAQLLRGGTILPQLMKKFRPPQPWESYGVRIAASFSAGYGLWAEVLKLAGDAMQLDGYVAIDSFHTRFDPDHTASDQQLAPLVSFALAAKEGPRVLWFGHSDVETPQTGPKAYASTTQVAAELLRLAGGEAGGFHVKAFDVAKDQSKEHGQALHGWGPAFLGEAVQEARRRKGEPVEPAPPTSRSPGSQPSPVALGMRALTAALREKNQGHNEEPLGSNGGQWVERYFAGCERDGKRLGLKRGFWCAAAACWCAFEAVATGGKVPHRWRASVLELWQDACSLEFGSARAAELVRSGRYIVQPGDLWIGTRGGPAGPATNPFGPTNGAGHVGRFLDTPDPDGSFETLDGNQGTGWGTAKRNLRDEEFVGVISYAGERAVPTDYDLAVAARLLKLSGDLAAGRGIGIDVIDAIG